MGQAPLKPLTAADVAARRRDRLKAHQNHLEKHAQWERLDERSRQALMRFALKAAGKERGSRALPPVRELEVVDALLGSGELLRAASCLKPAFTPREIIHDLMEGARPTHYSESFGDDDRLYFEAEPEVGNEAIETEIVMALQAKGLTISDYREGYCTDKAGKQRFKIGRQLKDRPGLLKLFETDARRRSGEFMVVVSRHPYDIARMSTDRRWSSCMAKTGVNFYYVKGDIAEGTLVSYLVHANDTNLEDPLSRQLLKPYRNDGGKTVLVPQQVYGVRMASFEKTNERICREVFGGQEPGVYVRPGRLYGDGVGQTCTVDETGGVTMGEEMEALYIPEAMRDGRAGVCELLDYLAIGYAIEDENGISVVRIDGTLGLNNLGMTQLPHDFDRVRCSQIELEDNALTSLQGIPPGVRMLIVNNNNLWTLGGGADDTQVIFAHGNSLTNLEGAPPFAERLHVGSNPIEVLDWVPDGVKSLSLNGCTALRRISVASLDGVTLILDDTGFQALEQIPAGLKYLSMERNGLTSLRGLSAAPEALDVSDNLLTSIADIPEGMSTLTVDNNQLETLACACSTLQTLSARGNSMSMLGELKAPVQKLDVSHNELTSIDGLPPTVTELMAHKNRITEVVVVPPGMRLLYLRGNPLEKVPADLPVGCELFKDNRRAVMELTLGH